MRNAKVRRRIAAGKLKLRIRDLRNLGPRSEQLLALVGIRSADGLRRRGAVQAYLALRRIGAARSLNMLWAIAGALDPWPEGCDWREVAAGDQRLPLLLAVDDPSATAPDAARRRVGQRLRAGARTGPAGRNTAAALGAWAPGLPFDERPASTLIERTVSASNVATEVPASPSGRQTHGVRGALKAKSRHRAGSR